MSHDLDNGPDLSLLVSDFVGSPRSTVWKKTTPFVTCCVNSWMNSKILRPVSVLKMPQYNFDAKQCRSNSQPVAGALNFITIPCSRTVGFIHETHAN